jgi:hypothetical protein
VSLLGSVFPLSFSKKQVLLHQLLSVEIRRGEVGAIRMRMSAAMEPPIEQAIAFVRQQPVAYVDENIVQKTTPMAESLVLFRMKCQDTKVTYQPIIDAITRQCRPFTSQKKAEAIAL